MHLLVINVDKDAKQRARVDVKKQAGLANNPASFYNKYWRKYMLTRNVNGVEFDIEIEKANEIYFFEEFYEKCASTGINDILVAIYNEKKEYTPESLFIELTGKCNFNCPFCYVHTCSTVQKQPFISFEQIKKDIDYLVERGLITCTISGGECFLHPEFEKIYEYIKNKGVLVTILSNLSLLTDSIVNLFKRLPPYKIDVTIYAMEEEKMKTVTCQKKIASSQVLNNILRLKDEGMNVTCKTPYNTLTEGQIPLITEWCKKHEIPYFYSMETFENYEGKNMEQFSMAEQEVYKDKILAKKQKYGDVESECTPKINFECKGGQYGLFISYDYKLRPCMPFYCVPEANFDIATVGLPKALEQMEEFIKKYKGTKLRYCKGCNKQNVCDVCIITQLSKTNLKEHMQKQCEIFQTMV